MFLINILMVYVLNKVIGLILFFLGAPAEKHFHLYCRGWLAAIPAKLIRIVVLGSVPGLDLEILSND